MGQVFGSRPPPSPGIDSKTFRGSFLKRKRYAGNLPRFVFVWMRNLFTRHGPHAPIAQSFNKVTDSIVFTAAARVASRVVTRTKAHLTT
jgi:hypothetical protein